MDKKSQKFSCVNVQLFPIIILSKKKNFFFNSVNYPSVLLVSDIEKKIRGKLRIFPLIRKKEVYFPFRFYQKNFEEHSKDIGCFFFHRDLIFILLNLGWLPKVFALIIL